MRVAFPTNKGEKIARHASFCRSFLIIDTKSGEREMVDNPLRKKVETGAVDSKRSTGRHLGTGRIVSVLLADAKVDLYVYLEAKTDFLMHLQREGIASHETQEKAIETVLETIEVKEDEMAQTQDDRVAGLGVGRGMRRGLGRRAGQGRGKGAGIGRSRGGGKGLRQGAGRRMGRGHGN